MHSLTASIPLPRRTLHKVLPPSAFKKSFELNFCLVLCSCASALRMPHDRSGLYIYRSRDHDIELDVPFLVNKPPSNPGYELRVISASGEIVEQGALSAQMLISNRTGGDLRDT